LAHLSLPETPPAIFFLPSRGVSAPKSSPRKDRERETESSFAKVASSPGKLSMLIVGEKDHTSPVHRLADRLRRQRQPSRRATRSVATYMLLKIHLPGGAKKRPRVERLLAERSHSSRACDTLDGSSSGDYARGGEIETNLGARKWSILHKS